MDQTRPEIKELSDDFTFKSSGSKDYVPVPTKKLLKFNIKDIKQTSQIDNFKTLPNGDENPKFGQAQDMFIVEFELNDPEYPEANGQTYSKWVSTAVSERSGLGKISDAVLGSPKAILEHKKGDLIGMPVQCALKAGVKDPARLVIDVDKLMPATPDQKKLERDVVLEDVPEGGITDEELDVVFP